MSENWYEHYPMPPLGNMMQHPTDPKGAFIKLGNQLSRDFYEHLKNYVGGELSEKSILEFGCGIGRIVMPLRFERKIPSHACDVSPWCIGWLKTNVEGVEFQKTENDPPLPYEDNYFDAVYSNSVWTHLPPPRQLPWLKEIQRILKPGGIALLTTSGLAALSYRRDVRKLEGWTNVSDDELQRQGMIYTDVDIKNHDGVEGEYGYVAHHPDHIRETWSQCFEVVDILPAKAAGIQDVNVLRKAADL